METLARRFRTVCGWKRIDYQRRECKQKQRRRALLLHLAGPDVQDIFSTLPDTGDPKDYKKAVKALNAYFVLKVNTTYARHSFRQAPGETTRQFATRFRRAAKDCDYGAETDNQIRAEILCKCKNTYNKRKLLEEGSGLTLARTLKIAENCENRLTTCAMSLDGKGEDSATVNRIHTGSFSKSAGKNEINRVTHEKTGRTPVIDAAMQYILIETQAALLEASPVTRVD